MIRAIPQPLEILFGGGVALACDRDGSISAEELQGLFAGDTRVLCTYRITLFGDAFRLLAGSRHGDQSAQWDYENPKLRTADGAEIEKGQLHLRLRRRVDRALHDDLTLESFAQSRYSLRLMLQMDADFADVFQVKAGSLPPRLSPGWILRRDGFSMQYRRRDFQRGLHVTLKASTGSILQVGSQIVFDFQLAPAEKWTCRVEACPEVNGEIFVFSGSPRGQSPPAGRALQPKPTIHTPSILGPPFRRGVEDLHSMVMEDQAGSYIAAGAPWFMALFGRDTLVTSLMAGVLGAWPARGALQALGRLQGNKQDDYRDEQPGKILHEMRRGELAHFNEIPHSPYYGTHDASMLYVLTLWDAFRWSADRSLLEDHLPTARRALEWCRQSGDLDGDGLLEYKTRSRKGYRNQGWKDAGDAIVHENGELAEPPIATVELQGYWFAAQLAMAELLDAVGDAGAAGELRTSASQLQQRVEDRFWMEDAGFYAMALDRNKQLVRSISSNPAQLLWCGLPCADRAGAVARRLLRRDMFSGYGLRTLSAEHRRYNPMSYQLGSVWPHDTALAAAGLMRYGFRDEAAALLKGLLDSAQIFSEHRLPELFCGFARESHPPVPYDEANCPQAWAAAVPLLAAQLFLGLVADAPQGKCYLNPWLPEWIPKLEMTTTVAEEAFEVEIVRDGRRTEMIRAAHPALTIEEGVPKAALWGQPYCDG